MTTGTQWLSAEEIQAAVDNLSADDLIEGTAQSADGVLMIKVAFNRSAARLGYGDDATTRVRASDFKKMADAIGEVVNDQHPLSEATEG